MLDEELLKLATFSVFFKKDEDVGKQTQRAWIIAVAIAVETLWKQVKNVYIGKLKLEKINREYEERFSCSCVPLFNVDVIS